MGGWRRTTACERSGRWISLGLDGETSDLEEAALRRHLERCASCAGRAAEIGGFTRLLRAAPLDEPERPLSVSGARVRPVRPRPRRVALAAVIAASVASAVAILAVPGPPGLLVQSSALRFTSTHEEITFAQSKHLSLEPFLASVDPSMLLVEVPAFSQRALR